MNSAAARHIHVLTCPARNSVCNFCKKKGHFAEVCRARQANRSSAPFQLHAVGTLAAAKFVDITVDNYTAQFKVDSGAEVSAVRATSMHCGQARPRQQHCSPDLAVSPLRVPRFVHGETSVARENELSALVRDPVSHRTSSWTAGASSSGSCKVLDELQTPKATLRAELFQGLGTLKDEYTILLRPDAVPFSLSVPRRIPIPLRGVVRHELDKLEEGGAIRRVDNPTPWCSGLVVVRKADGSYRLCVDLTQLNKVVLQERHILPTVEQVLGLLGDATVFSKQDATAKVTAPIRALLNKSATWVWQHEQNAAFEKIKELLTSDRCMAKYHPSYATTVSADASSFGLGAVLLQTQPSGERRPVAFASRSMTETEQRYSQTEKEALATTWSTQPFYEFVRGITFDVETDHLPLVSLFGKMELDMLPPRIQRLRLKTMRYQFRMLHVPGKLLATADTLSRITQKASLPLDTVELFAAQVVSGMSEASPLRPEDVRQAKESDGECRALTSFCQNGWPQKSKLPLHLSQYASAADELSVCDGVLLKGARMFIPHSLRPAVLTLLHEGHQSINRTKALARESIWWSGISADITCLVTNCEQFASTRVNHAEPLVSTVLPGRPWELVGVDLFHLRSQTFIMVVDYHSRKDVKRKDAAYKQKQAADFNRHHRAQDLSPLRTGQCVWVRPDQVKATVLSPARRPRSYVVETEQGGVLQRNRRHLVPFAPPAPRVEPPPSEEQEPQRTLPPLEPQRTTIVQPPNPLDCPLQTVTAVMV
nr:uncharacterized protein K02A2.6-like [Rhipicephalus microplus]